jgi:hypothetical protein
MKVHDVERVDFDGDTLVLAVDGKTFRVRVKEVSDRLAQASDAARRFYRISPSGYGIHWPEVDADLSVDGLIRAAGKYPGPQIGSAVLREKHE